MSSRNRRTSRRLRAILLGRLISHFDFRVDSRSDAIEKIGCHSRAESRDATREELVLWDRVRELEAVFEVNRPDYVTDLILLLFTGGTLRVNPVDFACLRQYAPDIVKSVAHPPRNRRRVVGQVDFFRDGEADCTWLVVDRNVKEGCPEPEPET